MKKYICHICLDKEFFNSFFFFAIIFCIDTLNFRYDQGLTSSFEEIVESKEEGDKENFSSYRFCVCCF